MNRQKSLWLMVACAVGGLAMGWASNPETRADDVKKQATPKKSAAMQLFMRAKLGQAQGILEGLTMEDFDQNERDATAMFLLTKAEQWKGSKDPNFIQHSDEFARLTTKVAKYAKDKNLDGAALSYMQLTLTCIECHRSVRDKTIEFHPLSE